MRARAATRKAGAFCFALLCALPFAAAAGEWGESFTAAPDGRLVIALEFGSVEVVRHAGDQVHLEAWARGVGAHGVRFAAHGDGSDVHFESQALPWVHWLRTAPGVRVRAQVPEKTRVKIWKRNSVEVVGIEVPPLSSR